MKKLVTGLALAASLSAMADEVPKFICKTNTSNVVVSFFNNASNRDIPRIIQIEAANAKKPLIANQEGGFIAPYSPVGTSIGSTVTHLELSVNGSILKKNLFGNEKHDGRFFLRVVQKINENEAVGTLDLTSEQLKLDLEDEPIHCSIN